MIRILLTYVIPILLPTALYFLWLTTLSRADKDRPPQVPWVWLLSAGALLAGIIVVGTTIMGDRGGVLVPAHIDDQGRLVPGHFR